MGGIGPTSSGKGVDPSMVRVNGSSSVVVRAAAMRSPRLSARVGEAESSCLWGCFAEPVLGCSRPQDLRESTRWWGRYWDCLLCRS